MLHLGAGGDPVETSFYTAFVLFIVACLVVSRSADMGERAPRLPSWLAWLSFPITLAVLWLLFPSDPATWSFANVVLYLVEPSFDPLRLVAVTVIGGGLFFGAVYLLYGSRRR